MKQKVLNEAQLREYIEGEVRKELMKEGLNEDVLSYEGGIGAILGRLILGPVIKSILKSLGVDPNGKLGRLIINAGSIGTGAALGSLVDHGPNPLGN